MNDPGYFFAPYVPVNGHIADADLLKMYEQAGLDGKEYLAKIIKAILPRSRRLPKMRPYQILQYLYGLYLKHRKPRCIQRRKPCLLREMWLERHNTRLGETQMTDADITDVILNAIGKAPRNVREGFFAILRERWCIYCGSECPTSECSCQELEEGKD